MDNLFKYLFFLILTTVVFSCQNRPSEVLSRKKMENVMYDMYIAEAIIDNDYQKFAQPENKEALINQVLEKHKITEARWDTSLSWYSDNIDTYIQINDSVKSRLQRNYNETNQLITLRTAQRNELVIHPPHYIPNNFYIASLGCDRGFKFSLDSVQLTERFGDNDSIFFQFNVIGVFPSDSYSLKSMLMIEYADTTVYQTSKLEENKSYSFPLSRYIEQDTIVSLNGFVNLSGKFPHVPIQLYKISLGHNGLNDSTEVLNKPINEELFLEPQRITD
jgi:hypothetical protein